MAKATVTKPRSANGGTTAPASAAKSPTTGLGGAKAVTPTYGQAFKNFQTGYQNKPAAKPDAPAAAPPAAAPVAPYTGTPWSSAEELSNAGADAKYNAALLNLGYKRQAYQQEYGLDPGYNDYKANPYSRAALLEQTYRRANRASGNSLAAMGQLYSGASQNAETYNRENNAQERNALESTYRKALQGVNEEEAGALATREEEKAAARWKAIEAAANAELEPEAAPAAPSSGGGGKKTNQKPVGASRWAKIIKEHQKKKGK